MASRIMEKKASYYSKPDEIQCQEARCNKPGVASELFFLYGPRNDEERNLERMKRMHLYTKETDAFSVGFLAKMI